MSAHVNEVREFWNANPCQSRLSSEMDRYRYFDEIANKRYHGREWHVPIVAQFESFEGKHVLEVGCSIATDGLQFARKGAHYVGIDLTPSAIEIAKERFELYNVKGIFQVANAEEGIPFPTNTFDHIYSFGVIHHSPHTEKIVEEMYRVLRPGGTFTVMLYNRSSINYHVEIMFLRKLFRLLLYPKFMPVLIAKLTGFDQWKLSGHREMMMVRRSMTKEQWVSMNTDGPYCPLAKVYNKKEAADLFQKFRDVRQEVWEFNTDHWPLIRRIIPFSVAQRIGRMWGWHRMVYGTK